MNILRRINWTNTLFLFFVHTAAIAGTIFLINTHAVHSATVILAISMVIVVGLAVTGGYHRLFSHKSYTATWPVRLVFLLLGAGAFEGSVLEWATDHRNHHRYTDTDRDPYNIKRGFWFAHVGWLILLDPSKRDYSNVDDLAADPLVKFQHRFFVPLAILMTFILPTAIASLWGDPWGGLIIAGLLRLVFNYQTTFCINSVCHLFGKHTYKQQSARDSWFTAFFTFGEGFHNFHHQFAIDYRNGIRAYDFDPTKWLIRSLAYLKLAKNLKRVSKEQIIRYRIQTDETRILDTAKTYLEQFITPLRERILHAAAYIDQLEKDYIALKKTKLLYLKGKWAEYHNHLIAQRSKLKQAHLELKNSLVLWSDLIKSHPPLAVIKN